MEMFGILFAVPAAWIASLLYILALDLAVRSWRWLRAPLLWSSGVVLALFAIEAGLLATSGAVAARTSLGDAFVWMHQGVFFLGIPALANVLSLRRPRDAVGHPLSAACLCALFALVLVLMQYGVHETWYGIEDEGGPFSVRPDP